MDTVDAVKQLLHVVRSDPGAVAHPEASLLQPVVDAAVTLFGAEAASIALYAPDHERLEFVVASGQQGAGVVGLSVPPSQGLVGYVFSTAQPMALSDVSADPRFDRATAERTGYVPRSIAAVPLGNAGTTLGVLQVLDKQDSATFSLQDMTMLGAFAQQASLALRASRVARDAARLLRIVLGDLDASLSDEARRQHLGRALARLDDGDELPFWRLVGRLVVLADRPDRELALVADVIEVIAGHRGSQVSVRRLARRA